MRVLSWMVMIPFALIVILFSASNLQLVSLSLWPLPFEVSLPMFTVTLIIFIAGFLAGGAVMWLSGGRHRRRAREERWRADAAERQLHTAESKLATQDEEKQSEGTNLPAKVG